MSSGSQARLRALADAVTATRGDVRGMLLERLLHEMVLVDSALTSALASVLVVAGEGDITGLVDALKQAELEMGARADNAIGAREEARAAVLVLTSRPIDENVDDLSVDQEERVILGEIASSPYADEVNVHPAPASTQGSILDDLYRARPRVVHFAGHGVLGGILVEDERRGAVEVSTDALRRLLALSSVAPNLKVLVLNVCVSAPQGQELGREIPFVIGTTDPVSDQGAIAFARGFYKLLGRGETIGSSFEAGVAQVAAESPQDVAKYTLFDRDAARNSWTLVEHAGVARRGTIDDRHAGRRARLPERTEGK